MATDTVEALCGKCKVPLEGAAKANDQTVFSCPKCGRSDTRKNVMREVAKHAEELMARHFHERMRGIARGSKLVQFSGKPIPKRSYRFISNLKL